MKEIAPPELINQLTQDTLEIKRVVEEEFLPLNDEELNFKPDPDTWSVLECIEHLNIAEHHYYKEMDKKIHSSTTTPGQSFKGGLIGNYFTNMMRPNLDGEITNKMTTVKKYVPSQLLSKDVIHHFINDQDIMLKLLEDANAVNLGKVRIKSALGSWLMFKLGDAFQFVTAHNQRHLIQAQNVLKTRVKTA